MSSAGAGSGPPASSPPPLHPRPLSPGAAASAIAASRRSGVEFRDGVLPPPSATPRSSLLGGGILPPGGSGIGGLGLPPGTPAPAPSSGKLSLAESARKLAVSAAGRSGILAGSPFGGTTGGIAGTAAAARALVLASPEGAPVSSTARLHLRSMIADKERELTALEQSRLERAEARLSEAEQRLHASDAEVAALKSNLEQVTADFRYNLKVTGQKPEGSCLWARRRRGGGGNTERERLRESLRERETSPALSFAVPAAVT